MTHFKTALLLTFVALQWACGGVATQQEARSPSLLTEKGPQPPAQAQPEGPQPSVLDAERFAAQPTLVSVDAESAEVALSHEDAGPGNAVAATATEDATVADDVSAEATATTEDATAAEATPAPDDAAKKPSSNGARGRTKAAETRPARLRAVKASIHLQVESLETARAAVQQLLDQVEGHVSGEQATIESWQKRATITLRVPVERTEEVLEAAEKLGRLTHRELEVQDISKDYFDAGLRLSSLRATLQRYQELLAHAEGVEQMLLLEKERSRIQLEIEALEGSLAFLRDRGQKSTVELQLIQVTEQKLETFAPEARFFPAARLGAAFNLWRPEKGNDELSTRGFLDVGISLGFDRQFSLDVDLLLDPDRTESGIDGGIVTLGGHFYSEFLGDGEATWMEPYIGLRAGYALIGGRHEFTGGAALGIDVYKNELVRILLDQRFGVLAGGQGAHALYQPTLGLSVGF